MSRLGGVRSYHDDVISNLAHSGPPAPDTSDLLDERTRLPPVTVEKFHHMFETGLIEAGEPYELLAGVVVVKDRSRVGDNPMTVDPSHAYGVDALADLKPRFKGRGCYLRSQLPIELPPYSMPEPDAAIANGAASDYLHRHPGPGDVLGVVEVSNSSLRRDRLTKASIYAAAGIPWYLIVNYPARVAELHTEPDAERETYRQRQVLAAGETVAFPVAEGEAVRVRVEELVAGE